MAEPKPTTTRPVRSANAVAPRSARTDHGWLLFVHQLPSNPSNLRVRTWRRLQQIGALPVKQALYVLPDTPNAREDFEWLKTEIEGAGGHAGVFTANAVDPRSHDELVDEFRRSREASYSALAAEVERSLKPSGRRSAAMRPRRVLQQFKDRLAAIEQVDFFGSAGRARVVALMQQLDDLGRGRPQPGATVARSSTPSEYRDRLWVTRPRPGIDRIASAWLIRKFVDPHARFAFTPDRDAVPSEAVAFDMFGGEFTHRDALCTFEALCDAFELRDAPLANLAAIVHDLDLKDGRFGAPEAPTVGLLIDGLRLTHADDDVLLGEGIALFESLYRALNEQLRVRGPRPVAPRRATSTQRIRGKRR